MTSQPARDGGDASEVEIVMLLSLQRSFSGCCSSLRRAAPAAAAAIRLGLLEFLCDALPAAILLRLLRPLRCELQSDALPAAILLRLLLIAAIGLH